MPTARKHDMDNLARLEFYAGKINEYLNGLFLEKKPYGRLYEAMRYSLLSGGKRIRPALVMEFCLLHGGDPLMALPLSVAVEMVHTYSLIHDDLPCMDDDDFRRGRPTNHKVYGEATAVLAGDALLTAAFGLIAGAGDFSAEIRVGATAELAAAAGCDGMVAGQILDLDYENKLAGKDIIGLIHSKKTGAMIQASAVIGAIAGGADQSGVAAARAYAESLGLAFQIRDDILDVTGSSAKLGKPIGSDRRSGKSTYVALYGLDTCENMVLEYTQKAISALELSSDFLNWLPDYLSKREK